MQVKKSYIIVIRLLFVLFTLQFIKDAFYKWDGFSFYMTFGEFLPDLSLAYLSWTAIVFILSSVLWGVFIVAYVILSRFVKSLKLEHSLLVVLAAMLPFYVKKTFLDRFSITHFTGLSRENILISSAVIIIVLLIALRKRLKTIFDSLLYAVDSRITPLVWLFALLFVISLPVSFMNKNISASGERSNPAGNSLNRDHAATNIKRPNIVMVVLDSLTARDMHLYGYERQTTPFIDEWAKNALVFDNVWAASNFTTPATMSLLTGQRVWTHRVWYAAYNHPVGQYKNNLPQILKDNGYDVYGFVQNGNAHPSKLGLQDAFNISENERVFQKSKWWFSDIKDYFSPDRPIPNRWIFSDSFIAHQINRFVPVVSTTLKPAEPVYDSFFDVMSGHNKAKPFFAYLHLMPPHYDYLPPAPYMGYFGDSDKFITDAGQWGNFNFNAEYNEGKQKDIDILRKRYDEFILYSDKSFESFIRRLRDTVDMSNTIIILTADHGESFSHGWLAHAGPPLYEPLIHVPLIVKSHDAKFRRVIDMPVEHIDVAPTVLDLVEIPVPIWMEGRSLKPLMAGEKINPIPVYSMYLQKNRSFGRSITRGTIGVREVDYKLIYYLDDDRKLLFNLKDDPGETINLWNDQPDVGGNLLQLIKGQLYKANRRITGSQAGTT